MDRGRPRFAAVTNIHSDLQEPPEPLKTPRRALAIGAHPDDIEFGCGGTVARWASAGCAVTMLVVTDGSKGTWDPQVDPTELAERRRGEQTAAADALGAVEVRYLGYVDGELEYTMELRRRVCEEIRLARPDVLLSHDPWKRYQIHPDHRATGLGAVDGMVAARDPLFFPDLGLEPHRPSAMLLWSADEPDHYEPIGDTLGTKVSALLCHSSQGETTMGDAHASAEARSVFAERIHARAAKDAAGTTLGLAEAFKRLTP